MRYRLQLRDHLHRVGDDAGDRQVRIDDAVDEGGIGAVLEQSAHKVGQQILMAADWRIDPAFALLRVWADDLRIERLPHPVQPLEFETCLFASERLDAGGGQGVMGGKLGIKCLGVSKEPLHACDISDVGRRLAREHRIGLQPALLTALYFGVPVSALDDTNHQPAAVGLCKRSEPIDDRRRALHIRLHGDPQPVPLGEASVAE